MRKGLLVCLALLLSCCCALAEGPYADPDDITCAKLGYTPDVPITQYEFYSALHAALLIEQDAAALTALADKNAFENLAPLPLEGYAPEAPIANETLVTVLRNVFELEADNSILAAWCARYQDAENYTCDQALEIIRLLIAQGSSVTLKIGIAVSPSASVFTRDEVVFTSYVTASEGSLQYQWYKDGAALKGATQKALTIDAAKLTDAGSYMCRVTLTQPNRTAKAGSAPIVLQVSKRTLDTPTGLAVSEGGTFRWNAVPNATGYQISVDGNIVGTSAAPSFDLETAKWNADTYIISVIALGDEDYYDSAPASIGHIISLPQLPAPTGVAIDIEGTLSWDAVPGSTGYVVYVNGTVSDTTTDTYLNIHPVGWDAGTYIVSVIALGNASFNNSAPAQIPFIVPKYDLDAPYQLTITLDGYATWQQMSLASGYRITVNGTSTVLDSSATSFNLMADGWRKGLFNVSIISLGDANFNDSSEATASYLFPKKVLDKPVITNITTNGILSWDAVPHASGYKIEVDGSYHGTTALTSYDLDIAYWEVKVHSIRLYALGDENYEDSAFSPAGYVIKKSNLRTPTSLSVSKGVASWDAVPYAPAGYEVSVDGSVVGTTMATSYDLAPGAWAVGTYTVSVRALGDASYNTSAAATFSYTIAKLQKITTYTHNRISKRITWNAITGATQYVVTNTATGVSRTVTDALVIVWTDAVSDVDGLTIVAQAPGNPDYRDSDPITLYW